MIRVSDHALLRFMERAGGLDVEAVRNAIGTSLDRAADAADRIGVDEYTIIADGLAYVVRGGNVVTVLPDGWSRS